jgi:hypothetical protein
MNRRSALIAYQEKKMSNILLKQETDAEQENGALTE